MPLIALAGCPTPAVSSSDGAAVPFVRQNAELDLLRARSLGEELGRTAALRPPALRLTAGEPITLWLEITNPTLLPVELFGSPDELALELEIEVTRWLPLGETDRKTTSRVGRLGIQRAHLAAGETFQLPFPLPPVPYDASAAVLEFGIGGRILAGGASLDGRTLPLGRVELARCRFLVLPPGWETLAEDPLGEIRIALHVGDEALDRHTLVAAAAASPSAKEPAIEYLVEFLLQGSGSAVRRNTALAALRLLAQDGVDRTPAEWVAWWDDRRSSVILGSDEWPDRLQAAP